MDELFGSVIYLIPIALIVFRVLSAITANMKKNAKRAAGEKTGEEGGGARQGQARQTARPVSARPDRAAEEILRRILPETTVPHWEREKQPRPKPKPAAKTQRPALSPPVPAKAPPHEPRPEPAAARTASVFPPAKLSPLQQGFVWAEVLGPPKAF